MGNDATNGYAEVNGLRMYYEVHGTGRPLVLLHGAYMTIDTIGPILPGPHATLAGLTFEEWLGSAP